MKPVTFSAISAAILLASVTAQATCGYAGRQEKLLQITHSTTSVTGRDLHTINMTDGSPVRSTFKVLKVVPGKDTYEYDVRMFEKYSVGLLNENPATDSSVPGSSDILIKLQLDLRNPENSEVHVHSHETIRDFSWEPGFLATHFDNDYTRKVVCEIVRAAD